MTTDQAFAAADSNAVLLTFVVGPYRLCASSARVVGIIPPPALARLPGSDRCQRGVFFHHGRTALVMGLRCKFGLAPRTRNDTGQVILVEVKNELAGFWVDEVIDAPETQHAVWRDSPPALRGGVFDRLAVLNQGLYLYVDFEKLLYADAGELAASLGTLAPGAQGDEYAEAEQKTVPETKPAPVAETTPVPATAPAAAENVTTAAENIASVSSVAPRAPVRATPASVRTMPSRAQAGGGRTVPRPRTTGPNPSHRAAALVGNTRPNVSPPGRDGGHYTTPPVGGSTTGDSGASENREPDNTLAWAMGSIAVVVLLIPVLWLLLSSSDNNGAKSSSAASRPSSSAEKTRMDYSSASSYSSSSSSPFPSASTTSTTAPATPSDGKSEILRVDTADFVMTVERGGKPEKSSVAETKTPPSATPSVIAAKSQTAPQGVGDWQEIVHVVKRGDTLWDIAHHYLGNPFKYPELAKLSQIRNPDLIHPGDRIHIKKKVAATR